MSIFQHINQQILCSGEDTSRLQHDVIKQMKTTLIFFMFVSQSLQFL